MFANCLVFRDVREVRSLVLAKKVMFGDVRSSVLMFGEHYEHLGAVKVTLFSAHENRKYVFAIFQFSFFFLHTIFVDF